MRIFYIRELLGLVLDYASIRDVSRIMMLSKELRSTMTSQHHKSIDLHRAYSQVARPNVLRNHPNLTLADLLGQLEYVNVLGYGLKDCASIQRVSITDEKGQPVFHISKGDTQVTSNYFGRNNFDSHQCPRTEESWTELISLIEPLIYTIFLCANWRVLIEWSELICQHSNQNVAALIPTLRMVTRTRDKWDLSDKEILYNLQCNGTVSCVQWLPGYRSHFFQWFHPTMVLFGVDRSKLTNVECQCLPYRLTCDSSNNNIQTEKKRQRNSKRFIEKCQQSTSFCPRKRHRVHRYFIKKLWSPWNWNFAVRSLKWDTFTIDTSDDSSTSEEEIQPAEKKIKH